MKLQPLHARTWSNQQSVLARINNTLVDKLNNEPRLLCYILILLDQDIVANAKVFDYGVYRTLQDLIKWLLVIINCSIETCKEDIRHKRPGVLTAASEPRLVWVKMAKRPNYSVLKQIHSLAQKFNNILEQTIAGDHRSHILPVHVVHNNLHIDHSGNFTPDGFIEYWHQIDITMKEFDREA